jgi:endonuclease/exonuclease/phosphatase family metal-dependent hydrolase
VLGGTATVLRISRLVPAVLLLAACAGPVNYTHPDGPRYTGCGDETATWNPLTGQARDRGPAPPVASSGILRAVSFNIQFSVRIDAAIAVLIGDPNLRNADVILLQEMDEPGVRRIAEAFGFCWVYYPATLHPRSHRQFGDAILSRYPFRDDHKVLLPHLGRFGRTLRIAAAATLDVDGTPVRVYSVHLATTVELGPRDREAQVLAVLDDAARFAGPVVIGGDMNARALGTVFAGAGFDWITRDLGKTTPYASLDHFFLRGLEPAEGTAVGKSPDVEGASDHLPIWTRLRLRASAP